MAGHSKNSVPNQTANVNIFVRTTSSGILRAPQMRNTGAQLSSAQCATAGPGTKRCYQLRLIQQVLERLEGANEKAYQGRDPLHFCDSCVPAEVSQVIDVRS